MRRERAFAPRSSAWSSFRLSEKSSAVVPPAAASFVTFFKAAYLQKWARLRMCSCSAVDSIRWSLSRRRPQLGFYRCRHWHCALLRPTFDSGSMASIPPTRLPPPSSLWRREVFQLLRASQGSVVSTFRFFLSWGGPWEPLLTLLAQQPRWLPRQQVSP